jgi:uncharacterized protein YbjT (DUF2867 family)
MPVAVTGGPAWLVAHLSEAFTAVSPQVRALVSSRSEAERVRRLGVKAAVGDHSDLGVLGPVLSGVHTLCHVAGGTPDPSGWEEADMTALLDAAAGEGLRRMLLVSAPGASAASARERSRGLGRAEEAVAEAVAQAVVIRPAHVYGPGAPWLHAVKGLAAGRPSVVVGSGRQLVAPVFAGDLAAVLVAADHRERVPSGTWGLEGPDRLTADEMADLLGGGRPRVHLGIRSASGFLRLRGIRPIPEALASLASPSLSDGPDAAAEFGTARTPLAEGLKRSGL